MDMQVWPGDILLSEMPLTQNEYPTTRRYKVVVAVRRFDPNGPFRVVLIEPIGAGRDYTMGYSDIMRNESHDARVRELDKLRDL